MLQTPAEIEKILFITLSCVGDVVMTTPVLQALHQLYPHARIDIVADKRSDIIFKHCPYRGDFYYKQKNKFLRGAPALIKQLMGRKYDVIVDLRSDCLAYLLKGRKRYTKWGSESYGLHAVESLMGIIRSTFGNQPIPAPHIWLKEDNIAFAKKQLDNLPGSKILAIAPGCGSNRPEKYWPTEHYAKLINRMNSFFDGVLVLGGTGEGKLAKDVTKDLNVPYIDMCSKTNLLEAAALLQQSTAFVGSDSGLGHVAAAMNTATLSFFSMADPKRYAPWGASATCLIGDNDDARNISVADAEDNLQKICQSR